jgi:branched-chain amino acid transport system ATP-binding protein
MGRNGMGKTTTVRAMMGLLPATKGTIRLLGHELRGLPPHQIARLGIGLVPEGRQVFPNLSVHENLVATARPAPAGVDGWSLRRVLGLFPKLAERRSTLGGRLSGGEQQMLAIGRALLTNPRLLILDEATEGLAPAVREEIWTCLRQLKRAGQATLVIDKHVGPLLALADRQVILEKGCCVWQGRTSEFRSTPGLKERSLGL